MDARLSTPMPAATVLPLFGWLAGAVFFFYAWVLRVAPSVMVEELMRDLAAGGAVLGSLSATYFYGYAGMQIPVGLLLDRFGPRRLMTLAALACAAGCVVFATSAGLWGVSAGRLLIGASAAFSLVGAMAVAGQWFPANRFALLSGGAMMLGMAGGVFGQAPLRLAVESAGWRDATLLLALGGLVLAAWCWAAVRDKRRGSGGLGQVLAGLDQVARNRQAWLNALAGLGASGPLLGFAGLWGVPYFAVTYDLDRTTAAAITSTMFIGWGAGAPLFGWLSDRIALRRPPLIAGMALCGAAIALLIYGPALSVGMATVLCFLCGLGGSAQIVCFAAARESSPIALSGTTIGFVNAMVTGGGALFQPLIGWLLDLAWTGGTAAGARVYDAAAYRFALSAVIVGSAVGLIAALAMRETNCRQRG